MGDERGEGPEVDLERGEGVPGGGGGGGGEEGEEGWRVMRSMRLIGTREGERRVKW